MHSDSRRNSVSERMRQKYKFEDELQGDLYQLLDSKDADLILAAELGKALLDKNDELSKHRENIVVEYTKKLENLEQEKYVLKRQLEQLEDEYQQQVLELQGDIDLIKKSLDKQAKKRKNYERQSSDTIRHLTEENQRLTMHVKQAREAEKHLNTKKITMNTEFVVKKSNLQEHFKKMEELNNKISKIVFIKEALEKEITDVTKQIENLNSSVEHSSNKIRQLERKTRNQEVALRHSEKDWEKIRSANQYLLGKLELVSRSEGSEPSKPLNLQSEMESSAPEMDSISNEDEKSQLGENGESNQFDSDEETFEEDTDLEELNNEVFSVYQQASNMCAMLRRGKPKKNLTQSMQTSCDSSQSSEDIRYVKVAQLHSLLLELQALLVRKVNNKCGADTGTCHQLKIDLEVELHQTKEAIEQTELRIKQVELASKKQNDQIQELKCKLCLVSTCLSAAEEEKEMFKKDLENLELSKEMMIKNTWNTRDEAVEAKNTAEVELAKNRIEMMQISSQLMEAVKQKVSLAEKLEDIEVNMQTILQDQVQDKLDRQCSSASDSDSGLENLSRKISRAFFGN